jgi:hypothetical protein
MNATLRGICFAALYFLLSWLAIALIIRKQPERPAESMPMASLWRATVCALPILAARLFDFPPLAFPAVYVAGALAALLLAGFLLHARFLEK